MEDEESSPRVRTSLKHIFITSGQINNFCLELVGSTTLVPSWCNTTKEFSIAFYVK
jgi:hypothetical protein